MNIAQAKQIPIRDILDSFGYQPVKQTSGQLWYLSPLRGEASPSFKVNPELNLWYDFGDGCHGDSIDLIMKLEGLGTISEALASLKKIGSGPRSVSHPPSSPTRRVKNQTSAMELTEIGPVTSKSLIGYLKKRGIDPGQAAASVKEAHYRVNDRAYFALALPNDSNGYELRNPFFKGTLGSKDISTVPGSTERVFVFEGMFDCLSAAEMFGGQLDGTAIILNSVALKERAAERIRDLHPAVVELYRDNDAAGVQLKEWMNRELPGIAVVDWADSYAGYHDLNEWHVQQQQTINRSAAR